MNAAHTPGPLYVGAQNDELYITAGRAPAKNNDHPWHDAPRVAIAKVFGPNEEANAARIVACVNACEGLADPSVVPDLLQIAERIHERGYVSDYVVEEHDDHAALAAAIAKARGRA